MADLDHLKQMVLNFRVSELQVLLGFAGRSKTGRKDELQSRALELIKLKSAPVQMKIRELHKRYPPASRTTRDSEVTQMGRVNHMISPSSPPPLVNKSDYSNHHGMMTRSLAPGSGNTGSTLSPLDFSSKYGHQTHHSSSTNFPVYSDVKFKKLPFYDILAELLKPATLVPSGSSRFQEANFIFHLTPFQAHDIAISRDLRPTAKTEFQNQIQMRFCLLETSCEQEDYFPPSICVKINGKMCPLPNPIPTNKPGVEPKRPNRPVNITALSKISPTVANHVNVTWASEYGRGYAVGIFLVQKMSACQLMAKLKSKGPRNADHTKALIKEKLTQDADSEIATTSLRVSLLCPLGKRRMEWPCRATSCSHLQCFDGSLYIQMNEKKPTWICPVCDKPALFDSLVIDGLFTDIFNNTEPDCTEIQFFDDGSWRQVVAKKEAHTIGSPVHKGSNISNMVTLSSGSSSSQSSISSSDSRKDISAAKEKVEVVDLTLDSSDDDEPPPKKLAQSFSTVYAPEILSSHCPNPPIGRPVQPTVAATPNYISSRPSSGGNLPIGHGLNPRVNMPNCSSSNNMYRGDMSMMDGMGQSFYPLSCSPYQTLLHDPQSALQYNFPGFELFNLLGQNDERQNNIMPYGLGSNSLTLPNPSLPRTYRSTQSPSSPEVISLD